MSNDIFGRPIEEQIKGEIRENKDVTGAEYKKALKYFGLNSNCTEEEWRNAHRAKIKNSSSLNMSQDVNINKMNDILKQHFKHIRWKENIKIKKEEIAANMENNFLELSRDQNFEIKKQIHLKYYGKIRFVNTIIGLERLYELYLEELRKKSNNLADINQLNLGPNVPKINDNREKQSGIYIMKHDYISVDALSHPIVFYLYNEENRTLNEIEDGEVTQEISFPEDIISNKLIPIENVLLNSKKYKKASSFAFMDDTEYFSDGHYRLTMTKVNLFDEDFIFQLHYGNHWIQTLNQSNEPIDLEKIIDDLKKYLKSCPKSRTKFNTR